MGRRIPSFRIASVGEEKEWKLFSQALETKIESYLIICFQCTSV